LNTDQNDVIVGNGHSQQGSLSLSLPMRSLCVGQHLDHFFLCNIFYYPFSFPLNLITTDMFLLNCVCRSHGVIRALWKTCWNFVCIVLQFSPALIMCPGYGWDRVNFPPSSCRVLDLVWEECS